MAALALSGAALAQPAQPPAFEMLDADRDGAITRQEALESPLLWAAFRAADRNGDNRLDRQEFAEEMALGAAMLGSGERRVVELTDQGQTTSARTAMRAQSASAGGSAPSQSASAGASAPDQPSQLFRRLDQDRDGFLSSAELDSEAALQGNWMAIDRNSDGRISAAEFRQMPAR